MSEQNKDSSAEFAAYFLAETSVLDIELPNGEPMLYGGEQVRAHLYGPATSRFAKARAVADREAARRVMNTMGVKSGRGKRGDEEDADADAKFLIAVTDRFENFPFPGGPEAVYREPRLKYIADQVRAHLADLGNFFPGGKSS